MSMTLAIVDSHNPRANQVLKVILTDQYINSDEHGMENTMGSCRDFNEMQ